MHRPLAHRLTVLGLGLALAGLVALPAQATPATRQAAPGTAPLILPALQPVPVPAQADARAARTAPRPAADPPGSESLWFVGVFQ